MASHLFSSPVYILALAMMSGLSVLAHGCQRGRITESADELTPSELVSYYSPRDLEILPFTKPRSFDDDLIPDGIGVSIRTLDGAGDPVKAYGTFMFELYGYRGASSNKRDRLIQSWSQPVLNWEDQTQFWEHVTATYEFQLSWEGQPIPPQQRYVLVASFQAQGSDRLFDDYEFEFRVSRNEILNALREP